MAKGTKGAGLNFTAKLSIEDARRSAAELKKIMAELKITSPTGAKAAFDTKPLNDYQKEQLKIKQTAVDAQIANKKASLELQQALQQERLELIRINKERAESARLNQQERNATKAPRTVQISNSQSEIDAYNNAASPNLTGTVAGSSGLAAKVAELNKQFAENKLTVAEYRAEMERLNAIMNQSNATVDGADASAKKVNLTREQSARLLAEEKYLQQQRNKELKNSIREDLNAKGSLEQRRAALIRLNTAYDRMSALERSTPAGQRMQGIIGRLNEQVLTLEKSTGRSQRNVGNYLKQAWSGLKQIANLLPGLGVAGILAFLTEPLLDYISKLDIFKTVISQAKLNLAALNETQKAANQTSSVQITSLKILYKTATDVNVSMKDRLAAANELKRMWPEQFAASRTQAILNGEEKRSYEELTGSILQQARALAVKDKLVKEEAVRADAEFEKEKIRNANRNKLNQVAKTGDKVVYSTTPTGAPVKTVITVAEQIKNENKLANEALKEQDAIIAKSTNVSNFLERYAGGANKVADAINGGNKLIQDPLKQFDAIVKNASQKADLENLQNALQAKMDALAPNDKQREVLRSKIEQVKKIMKDAYEVKTPSDRQNPALSARNTLQREIDEINRAAQRKQLTSDREEIKAVEDKYKAIGRKIEDFNKKFKGKYKVDASGLVKSQDLETDEIKAKQAVEKQKQLIETQKHLFAEYEQYKTEFGAEEADKRFAKDLQGFKDYVSYLESLLPEEKDVSAYANKMRDLINKDLKPKADDDALKRQQAQYADAYKAALTHSQALLAIESEYQRQVKALGDGATKEQLDNLKRLRDERVRNENEANADQLSGYADLLQNLDAMTRAKAIEALEDAKAKYAEQYRAKLINAQFYLNRIAEIESRVDGLNSNNIFKGIENAIKRYKKAKEDFDNSTSDNDKKDNAIAVVNARAEMFKKIGEGAQAASVGMSGMADIFNQLNIGGDKLQDTLKGVAGVLSGAGELAKGIAIGDPVSIVTGSINLLSSAIGLFDRKDKNLQKKIDGYQRQLTELGQAYKQLDRQVQNSVGESVYSDQAAQIENLQKQREKLIQMRDAEEEKKKTDQAKIDEYNAQIADIPNQIDDINRAISQNLIQTNFKELSNNLADAFAEAFSSGEDSAEQFEDVFDKVIANAIKNSLKLKILDPIVKKFTDDLTAYALANNNSIIGFDFDSYKSQLENAGKLFQDAMKGSEEFFEDADSSSSSLNKSIKGITSDQASALEGIQRGQYDQLKKHTVLLTESNNNWGKFLNIGLQKLKHLQAIENNTYDTVQEIKKSNSALTDSNKALSQIVKNTQSGSLRGAGLG